MLALVHSAAVASVELDTADFDLGGWVGGLWHDALGALVVHTNLYGSLYLVKLDGSAARLSKMPGGANRWNGIGWYQPKDQPILVGHAGAWRVRHLPSTAPLEPSGTYSGALGMVVLADRALRFSSGKVFYGDVGVGLPGTVEKTLSNSGTAGFGGTMLPAEPWPCERWWCAAPADGRIRLYNSTTKLEERAVRVASGFKAIGYSRKHDVFVVVRGTAGSYVLDVYANEPVAANLSAPLLSPAARRGAISAVSVTLTGADGEPCAERVITFSATAGTVDPAAAETDANGVAKTTYRAPSPAVAGVTLTATLVE